MLPDRPNTSIAVVTGHFMTDTPTKGERSIIVKGTGDKTLLIFDSHAEIDALIDALLEAKTELTRLKKAH